MEKQGERGDKRGKLGGKAKQLWKNLRGKEQTPVPHDASASKVESSDIVAIASDPPAQAETSLVTSAQSLTSAQVIRGEPPDLGLWGKAADSLDPPDREKLDSLVRSNQEASRSDGADSRAGHFGLELVLSYASDLKDGDKKAGWIRVLNNIINAAIGLKSLGDAAVEFDKSGYAALGWSIVSFGLQVAAGARDMREFVIASSEVVTSFLVKYRQYETFRGSDGGEEYDHCLTKVYKAILLYELALNDYLLQSQMERAVRAGGKLDDRSISQRKKAIQGADADVAAWVQIIMVKSNNNISLLVQRMLDQTSPNLSDPTQECLQSLSFPEMEDRYKDIEHPAEGTCKWLVAHDTYRHWAACDRSLLWIKGKPGSGKSTLLRYALNDAIVASNIQDQALHQYSNELLRTAGNLGAQAETSALILSFFFHGRGVELQKTPLGLFRSLLHQLLSYVPGALSGLVATYLAKCKSMGAQGKGWHWNLNDLVEILKLSIQEVSKSRPVWLFVDALDECGKDNANKLVEGFESLLQGCASTAQFRICFSCRHYPILRPTHPDALEICPDLENGHDISTYAQARLFNSLSGTTEAVEAITNRASGVFMWARLVVERILDLDREGEAWSIKGDIDDRPQQLDDLYQDLIQEMKDKPSSLKLFQWICFAMRPLSLDELRWAMIVEADFSKQSLGQYESEQRHTSDMEKKLKTLSCGLAEVVLSSDEQQPVVQFIHQSVKDFVMEKGLSALHQGPNSDSLETERARLEGIAHHRLSRICICYFRAEEIARSKLDGIDVLSLSNKMGSKEKAARDYWLLTFPLLKYAITFWIEHVELSNERGVPQDDLLKYVGWPSKAVVELWTHICQIFVNWADPQGLPSPGSTLLHIVARSGLEEPLRMILQSGGHLAINATTKIGETPLYQAAWSRHHAAVRILLEHGADVNAQGGEYGPALCAASYTGREQIVRILLEHGADVNARNARGTVYGSALCAASYEGHKQIVRILLEQGADINAQGGDYGSALHAASYKGHEQIVRILLEQGADINAQGGEYGSALQVASSEGYEQIVRILLEQGADINAQGGEYGSALYAASSEGYEQIVRILLEQGADINAQGGEYGSALYAASSEGYEQIVRILLEQGADINAQRGEYGSALYTASSQGYEQIVRILLEQGADINAQGGGYGSALYAALSQGYEQIVYILLDYYSSDGEQVNSNASDALGNTPLMEASSNGHLEIVQKLVARGADLKALNKAGFNALFFAAESGQSHVVNYLFQLLSLYTNSEQDPHDYLQQGLLFFAIKSGDEATVHEVLSHTEGEELNQRNFYGMTPLSIAVARGQHQIVRLLLQDPRIDIEPDQSRDTLGRSLMWWAKSSGDEELVRIFSSHQSIACPNDELPVLDLRYRPWNYVGSYCDLCLRNINRNDGYSCKSCWSGTFVICPDCFLLGGRCLDESHVLLDRRQEYWWDDTISESGSSSGSMESA